MKKDPALGEQSSERAEAGSEREGENSEERWGGGPDKPVIRKPLREGVVARRAGLTAEPKRSLTCHV